MDSIELPQTDALPMDAIAPGVVGLRIAFVNVFGVLHPDASWTLIDAAIPHMASHIQSWAKEHFSGPPNAIILTHGHFDHAGSVRDLADAWNVPIYTHPLEFPYLTGEKEYPAPNWKAGGGIMPLLSPTFPRSPIDVTERLRALPGEGAELSLAELPGWTLLHTPGHTPGHVSFYRKSDQTLLVGDAFCTTKPESFFEAALAQHTELHGPPAYFTSDWSAAKASVHKLAALEPKTVIPGHGKPLSGPDVPAALYHLAQNFEQIAEPDNVEVTPTTLLALLAEVQHQTLTPEQAAARLANLPFEDTGEARIDHHRTLRTGLPEVIYAAGKTPDQVANIFLRMAIIGTDVLATRATPEAAEAVHTLLPAAKYHASSRTITLRQSPAPETKGHVSVVCAGTSDLPIAEEAAITAELFNTHVTRLYDVGVAGIHRLLAVRPQLALAHAIIVCAGMEGALPSVVGGLVGVPVIAVPTSIGYGASFAGASALLGMLNSCSPNVSVVNIDNGFGAAYSATLIARAAHR